MRRLPLLAALSAATIVFSAPAEAAPRHHQPTAQAGQITKFCGDRFCPVQHDLTGRPYNAAYAASPGRSHRAAFIRGRRQSATTPQASPRPSQGQAGSGIVRSRKTGATARVSPRFAPIAQAIVDELERGGAAIRFMGGYRSGKCWAGGLHPCGLAIDLCQTARGVVDPRCKMPSRAVEARVAAAHGALSGGVWCNQDRGHVQLGQTAGACGRNLYAAVSSYQAKVRRHHGKRVRYAARRQ